MAKKLDKLIIIDLEATCWEDGNFDRADGQKSEIIEIGLCLFDLHRKEQEDARSIIVKPAMSTVSEFCTKLTTLTQADVDKGVSFSEACRMLTKEFDSKLRTWGSWGDYDRAQFERECAAKKVSYPFGRTHINIKNLYAVMNQKKSECAVGQALEQMGLLFDGTPHRGIDDAKNIARIFKGIAQLHHRGSNDPWV